jgi:hypothetical protein
VLANSGVPLYDATRTLVQFPPNISFVGRMTNSDPSTKIASGGYRCLPCTKRRVTSF